MKANYKRRKHRGSVKAQAYIDPDRCIETEGWYYILKGGDLVRFKNEMTWEIVYSGYCFIKEATIKTKDYGDIIINDKFSQFISKCQEPELQKVLVDSNNFMDTHFSSDELPIKLYQKGIAQKGIADTPLLTEKRASDPFIDPINRYTSPGKGCGTPSSEWGVLGISDNKQVVACKNGDYLVTGDLVEWTRRKKES